MTLLIQCQANLRETLLYDSKAVFVRMLLFCGKRHQMLPFSQKVHHLITVLNAKLLQGLSGIRIAVFSQQTIPPSFPPIFAPKKDVVSPLLMPQRESLDQTIMNHLRCQFIACSLLHAKECMQ